MKLWFSYILAVLLLIQSVPYKSLGRSMYDDNMGEEEMMLEKKMKECDAFVYAHFSISSDEFIQRISQFAHYKIPSVKEPILALDGQPPNN